MNRSLFKKIPTLHDVDVNNKTCIVRLDLNVPLKDGKITDLARLLAAKRTLDHLIDSKCKIVILSHLSRVKKAEDITSGKKSLKVVADALQKLYPKMKVIFVENNRDKKLPSMVKKMKTNQIILLENTRYNDFDLKKNEVVKLESKNNPQLAKFWASLGDVYVNDAFATIHRGHASNAGIAKLKKQKCIGYLIQDELEHIIKFNKYSSKPIVSVVGGAKIADKIILLEKLMQTSDQVLIGGGMAFTFLTALGINCQKSLVEKEMLETAKNLYTKYKNKIILPIDVACATDFANQTRKEYKVNKIPANMMGLDVGSKTIKQYLKVLKPAQTIFWNGPTGVFEFSNFDSSTKAVAKAIAAAAVKFAKKTDFSWVSTGGGATLAVIQGDELPGLFFKK